MISSRSPIISCGLNTPSSATPHGPVPCTNCASRAAIFCSPQLPPPSAPSRGSTQEIADRVPTVDEQLRQMAADASLALEFRGQTAAECRAWQQKFAAQLRTLLGPHQPPAQWKTMVEHAVELRDHRREELVLTAEGHPPLPLYLLVPRDGGATTPAGILALHGHGRFGYDTVAGRDDRPGAAEEIDRYHYDYGRQLVRHGYVVAVPCLTPFGRRLDDRRPTTVRTRAASPSSACNCLARC